MIRWNWLANSQTKKVKNVVLGTYFAFNIYKIRQYWKSFVVEEEKYLLAF